MSMKKFLFLLVAIHYSLFTFHALYGQMIPYHKGEKWGFCDTAKVIKIPPKYESVDLFNHGHAKFSVKNHWGFVDTLGKEFLFPDSISFIAYYGEYILVSNGKKNALMDYFFNYVVPFKYDAILEFDHGLAPVRVGEKWGYINKTGNEVVGLIYGPGYHGKTSEGLTWQMKDGKAGFIDTMGKIAIPFIYDLGTQFLNGFAQVRKSGKWIYIDHQGKELDLPNFDYVGPFFEGLSAVKLKQKTGFIDTTGKLVIPITFDNAAFFHDGMAGFMKNDKWGYINTKGDIVIKPKYHFGGEFQDGFANIQIDEDWVMINKKGKKVSSGEFDYIIRVDKGLYIIKRKWISGLMDNKGKKIIPMKYRYVSYVGNGLFIMSIDGKSGVIDCSTWYLNKTVKSLIPFNYDSIEVCSQQGLFYARRLGKYGYIDLKGREYWD